MVPPGVRRLPRALSSAVRARPAHPSQLHGRDGEPRGGRFVRRRIHASGEDGPRSLRRRRDLPRRVPCRSGAYAGPPRRRDVPGRDHAHREVQGCGALPRKAGRVRRNGGNVRGRYEPDLRGGLGLPSGAAELPAPHLTPSVWRAHDERWLHEPAAGVGSASEHAAVLRQACPGRPGVRRSPQATDQRLVHQGGLHREVPPEE